MNKRPEDRLYASPLDEIVDFQFDETVANVFADMINRSVPGYGTIINMIGVLASHFVKPASRCYDLGCSLGAATLSMRQRISVADVQLIAVDNAEAMISRFQQILERSPQGLPVELVCADLRDVKISDASMVVMNFTLQFVPRENRQAVLQGIFDGLLPGACLVLSEKLHFEQAKQESFERDMHLLFKKLNGYSELEIAQKRSALENVLLTETAEQHQQRLLDIGFSQVWPWFQCFNFASFIAIK